jgi:hypothetical protein
MKKAILLTGALLALTASLASAQVGGLTLAYTNCYQNGGTTSYAPACPAPGTTYLVGTFRPGTAYPNFTSYRAFIDIQSQDGSLPDYWSATCGGQAVSVQNNYAAGSDATLCPPAAQEVVGGNQNSDLLAYTSTATTATIDLAVGRSQTMNLNNQHYHIFRINIVEADRSACTGCGEGVCIVFRELTIETDPVTTPRVITAPDPIKEIRWQTTLAGTCPQSVEAQNKSWGQIKALYR